VSTESLLKGSRLLLSNLVIAKLGRNKTPHTIRLRVGRLPETSYVQIVLQFSFMVAGCVPGMIVA
jgi:hypothetical protein